MKGGGDGVLGWGFGVGEGGAWGREFAQRSLEKISPIRLVILLFFLKMLLILSIIIN